MVFTDVRNPQWADTENTAINVLVVFEELGEVPFTARPDDTTDYGPEIFQRAIAGDFGDIAEWVLDFGAVGGTDNDKSVSDARQYLASTDWYVTRQVEIGKAIPPEVVAGRKAAREKANG